MLEPICRIKNAAVPLFLVLAAACGTPASEEAPSTADMDVLDTLPPGWSEPSHTTQGAASYTEVFPQDRVARIDITIGAADWKAMQDDMVSLLGAFGAGGMGGMGGMLPPELAQACEGKVAGATCRASFMGTAFDSTCSDFAGALVCAPPMGGGGMGGGLPGGGGIDLLGRNPIYVPCTVRFGDRQWKHVGIRYKGNSSLTMAWSSGVAKLPLHLSFDKYEDQYPLTKDQRLWGFKEMSLSNAMGDASFIREKVANDIFQAAGVPTPASAFYRVYIDFGRGSTYFGLYTANELPAKPMLNTLFKENKGNLYKPEGTNATWVAFDEGSFEKKSNEDEKDWSDIKAAVAALNSSRTDAAAWREGLEKSFNVDGFMRWLAVNTLIQNWDAYGLMAHNYYLYGATAAAGQLQWIQWDSSLALQSGRGLSFAMSEVKETWPLIRYTLDDPEYKKYYYGYLKGTAAGAFSEAATESRFRAAHALVAPYVTGAQGEIAGYTFLTDPARFNSSVEELNAHVKSRQQALQLALMGL